MHKFTNKSPEKLLFVTVYLLKNTLKRDQILDLPYYCTTGEVQIAGLPDISVQTPWMISYEHDMGFLGMEGYYILNE